MTRVELTDEEWMHLINGDRGDSALPHCCANISALRDAIIAVARNGGEVDEFTRERLKTAYEWCASHFDDPTSPLIEMCTQLHIIPDDGHTPQGFET